ncbi:miro-like protein (macronuclear) [Tetrahymena thermophila SB210]|uniref:Miro-like protein n=1 Tax=Tetrahymena thermophila (strain SB210) TaxID=312017 RepID=Q24IK3_TETTS|nr:miro-like protein [Tetrahymena thermophila SB210]EAS07622.2 miro-like protein [Tetrahymena thermophila SB210]|eukprot:XP_001027864.2 miro-like protein [Tetrahymena thermophila SB210]
MKIYGNQTSLKQTFIVSHYIIYQQQKAEKEAQKEESKIPYSGGSKKNNHYHHKQHKSVGKPVSESKNNSDLYEENKKQNNFSPQLKELMTNYVMEAGAFDPFYLNDAEQFNKKSKNSDQSVDIQKPNERVKTQKHKKQANEREGQQLKASQNEEVEQQENNEVDLLEVRKRSFSINNGTLLLPNDIAVSSRTLSSEKREDNKDKDNSDKSDEDGDNLSDEDKSGSGNSSDSDKNSSSSGGNSDDSSDDEDDDEESIRIKESQQSEKNENGLYESEFFNSQNNWGRRKKLNLSQTSESFDENLYCNYENFNGSSSVNLKQIKTNVMIIGESKIGKTELLSEMFTNNQFPSKLNANYSLDLMIHKLSKSEQEYKICLWIQNLSTMQYQWIIEQVYYKIVSTFIFLYNDSDPKSLEAVKTTYQKTKAQAPNAKYILIGITTHSTNEQKEIQEKAKAFSDENNFTYYFERIQSQPTEETHLNSLKHYVCPLLFDKESNDSFKCSDFQICQNSTQDSPKSIEFSLNKNISQEFCFAKHIQNSQSPVRTRNIDLSDIDQIKYSQNINFKDGNGYCLSETRRQQKNFTEEDANGKSDRYFIDQDENMQYTQSNKTLQTFPLINENNQIIQETYSWPIQSNSPINFDQNKNYLDKSACINLIPSEIQSVDNQIQDQQLEQQLKIGESSNLESTQQNLQLSDHTLSEIPIKISQQG